jgi:long-chain fatty acid transport protein
MKILSAFAAAGALAPAVAFGLGVRIPDQNPYATARGNAFAATADNASAVYYNPAGITQLDGTSVLVGAYAIALDVDIDLAARGAASTGNVNGELQWAPQFFASWKLKESPFAIGFGVYSPFGFSIEYPDTAAFRTLARKGKIEYLTFNPVIAWQVTDTLSVAVGVNINTAETTLERGVLAVGDSFRFKGNGTSFGFNAGLLWKPHRMHSFGINYRSASNINFDGQSRLQYDGFTVPTPFGPFPVPGVRTEESANVDFDFPQNVVLGYSFRPTEKWNLEFNWDWTDWNTLNDLVLDQPSGDVVLPFGWQNSSFYEFGVTRMLGNGLRASVGYIYSENSSPNATFNPIVPDSNRHIYSIGIGQSLDHLNWDIAYQYAHGPARNIDNGTAADGTYRFDSHAITFSLGYRF